jgi:hypothetical protein
MGNEMSNAESSNIEHCEYCTLPHVAKIDKLEKGEFYEFIPQSFDISNLCVNCEKVFKLAGISITSVQSRKSDEPLIVRVESNKKSQFDIGSYKSLLKSAYIPKYKKVKYIDHRNEIISFEK